MQLYEYLQELFDYHYWANARSLAAAESLSPEQLVQPQGHSWGSVYGVLLHMMNAEWIWLRRWLGESPSAFPDPQEFPTLAALRAYWAELEGELRAFLADQSEASLEGLVTYTNTRGQTYQLALWQMAVHVANHGSHHRGELAAMFALLQAPHSEEDWVHYFLEKSGQR